MARALVVHPPVSVARDFIDYPQVADLGAVQLAAALRARGHDVRLVDAYALPGSTLRWRDDGRAHLGAPVDALLEACAAASPDGADALVVAYTPFHRPPHRDDLLAALLEGLRARFPEAPLLLADAYQSGQHYVEAEGVLEAYPEADAWVKYEAEVTVPALLEAEAPPRGVHRGEQADLEALPLPAWDLVDLDAYWTFHRRFTEHLGRRPGAFPLGPRTLPLVTSRGCPFTCAHCSSNPDRRPDEPKTQRRLPPERLHALVDALADHGASHLYVLDELLNVRRSHFDAFLEAVAARDLRFEVPNGFRADYLEPRHLARMRGRVTTVSVSAESGSPRVLGELVDKKLDLAAIRRAAENAEKAGVPLLVHYMIGLPGETEAEINETLAFALELWDAHQAYPAVQFATPLPGTRLAAETERRGHALPLVDDWGPRFQQVPTTSTVPAEKLALFMRTFRHRLRESRGPKKLVMNVTYVCNNRCTFCAVGTRTQVDGHPTRQREILDKYRRHGITLVDFDGGEPTLNPELVPLIRHARRVGYERVNVTTNGRLCAYEGFAKKLVRSGLTTLLFSVHGPDFKSHAREVGVAEAFDQTVAGIRHCVEHAPAG
ncbi:MAG TPA: radical SAM protein, partial [Polyangiaceae bacterium LLY-WYZ-15_(1-7)]|nr:radical SAM protein [Polyangiaceae bacterium LLY-WYZ-15_(1-7)]